MKKILPFLFCYLLVAAGAFAQVQTDSLLRKDTLPVKKDSTVKKSPVKTDSVTGRDTTARIDTTRRRRDTSTIKKPVVSRDTSLIRNIVPVNMDSVAGSAPADNSGETIPAIDTATQELQPIPGYRYTPGSLRKVLMDHPYFNFFGKPVALTVREKKVTGKEGLFYFMTGLLIYFGLIRLFFGRYLDNMITLFFRATMRGQQIRDQLLQSPLPSLLLNFLFLITGGMFLTFVAFYYDITPVDNRWMLLMYSAALLLVIYLGKFIILKITGWVFNVSVATDTYIFIVFLVNKIIGIFLLPVLVVMSFSGPLLFAIMLILSYTMLVFFMGYRFIISYKPIRNEIRVNRFHFFLYLCAFEIAPLLLIYKVLLIFVERSH